MKFNICQGWVKLWIVSMVIFLAACGGAPDPGATPTPTATPTPALAATLQTAPTPTPTATVSVPVAVTQPPKAASRCEGLGGTIEVKGSGRPGSSSWFRTLCCR